MYLAKINSMVTVLTTVHQDRFMKYKTFLEFLIQLSGRIMMAILQNFIHYISLNLRE